MTVQLFFTDKTKTISSQFSPPLTQDLQPTISTAQTPIFYFCPLTEVEVSKLLLSNHPTTGPLDPIPLHLHQAISPTLLPALTHIINTYLLTGIFPTAFKQARVTPLLKKPTLNTSLIENYRPVSLLPFIAKTLEQVVFNQVSLFLSQNNKLDTKQSGFRSGHLTETALLSVTEALRIAKIWFQIISPHSAGSVCRFWHCQSSDPPVHPLITGHHWDSTSLVWILSHWSVFHGGLGRGGIQSTPIGHRGSPGIGSWTPPLLHIHYITGSIIQAHGFSYHCHTDDTQLYLSFQPDDPTVAARISSCISAWMKEHHQQLNLAKTELLVFPATPTLQYDFTIQLVSSTITPSASVRNLGVIFDDQLPFKEHIAKNARSCRCALQNIRKIRPCLTEHAAQLLVQALVISRLDYCNALLAGLPSNTIKPLQMIQNAAARLVFNEPMLHLSLSPCTTYKLQLASSSRHWCLHIEQPQVQHPPTSTHYYESTSPPEVWDLLVSNASWYQRGSTQRGSKSLSRTFSFTVPG